MQELEKDKSKELTNNEAINIPEFLDLSTDSIAANVVPLSSCPACERVQCQGMCMYNCQNCLGFVACLSECQNGQTCSWCQGNSCEALCQNCLGTSTCQTVEECVNCQGVVCQTCQNCLGAACQTCLGCQYGCEVSAQTVYTPAQFTYSDVTDTSAVFTIKKGTGYQNVRLLVRLFDDPNNLTYDSSDPKGDGVNHLPMPSSELNILVDVLQPGTHYAANVHSFGGDAPRGEAGLQDFNTNAAKPKIDLWSWSASNGLATPAQTQRAYKTMMDELPAEGFSYQVWNDLVDKIYEVVSALNLNWSTTYTTYAGAKLNGPGQILTASKYNSARLNVGMRHSTGINPVTSATEFTWSYIFNLVQKLNEWITEL